MTSLQWSGPFPLKHNCEPSPQFPTLDELMSILLVWFSSVWAAASNCWLASLFRSWN